MAEKKWVARYEYGQVHIEQVEVVKLTKLTCTLAERYKAAGFNKRVSASEVFDTRREAAGSVVQRVRDHVGRLERDVEQAKLALAEVLALAGLD